MISASAMPAEMAAIPPEPVSAMPENALMIPKVVPKRPTKGAVAPMVARPERPRLRSARLTAVARWMARLAASTAPSRSRSASPVSTWYCHSCSPGFSTFARWDSLYCLPSETSIASLILPCFRKRATSGAYLRDCWVAWRNVQNRSIATAMEYMDMMKSRMTTAHATPPMCSAMVLKSNCILRPPGL